MNLGWMYDEGKGVPKDIPEAARWYRLAADQGHVSAAFSLGNILDLGQGTPENDTEAALWYRRASDKGHAKAQYWLGFLVRDGKGTEKDTLEASRLFALSLSGGYDKARIPLDELLMSAPSARSIQLGLKKAGHYTGAVDGQFGPASRAALASYCGCSF